MGLGRTAPAAQLHLAPEGNLGTLGTLGDPCPQSWPQVPPPLSGPHPSFIPDSRVPWERREAAEGLGRIRSREIALPAVVPHNPPNRWGLWLPLVESGRGAPFPQQVGQLETEVAPRWSAPRSTLGKGEGRRLPSRGGAIHGKIFQGLSNPSLCGASPTHAPLSALFTHKVGARIPARWGLAGPLRAEA